ncbi:tyrosine-protein phosphatase non-receptor type 22 [Pholidichthys leucotaenia]
MEQQAWILRRLLDELERQETVDKDEPNSFSGQFTRLKSQSTKYRTEKTFLTKTAEKQENIKKNRYKDIVPFDHSRVKLTLTTSKNDTDYINASFIKGMSGSRAYIATQGPLPHTVVDFLRMIWEYNIQVIVMACREFEMGKKKCEVYWPRKEEEAFVCEPFKVYCDSEENRGDYLTRTLRIIFRKKSRTLKQLHYINWPDHGVPDSIPPILDILEEMRFYQAHDDIPICIHCSAGCGRTGALCVIDFTWNLLRKQMISSDFSIYNLVQDMRTQRPSVVQTKEQYELVYRTIKLLFQRYLQSLDALPPCEAISAVSPPTSGNELSDLSEFQHIFEDKRNVLPQSNTPLSSASENSISLGVSDDMQTGQPYWQHLGDHLDALTATHNLHEESRTVVTLRHASQRPSVAEEGVQAGDDVPSVNPPSSSSPDVAAAICLMVEDPYFDTSMSSPSSEEATMVPDEDTKEWTLSPVFKAPSFFLNDQAVEFPPDSGAVEVHAGEEDPPPLPERTPESYVLAVEPELLDPSNRLSVIVPHSTTGDTDSDLGGSPPSPVPPLPERTPESYQLAIDKAPAKELIPAVNLNVIGTSSEWCGSSQPSATAFLNETKTFERSKSLRAKVTFTAPAVCVDRSSNGTSNFLPYCLPPEPLTPPQSTQTEDSLMPPFPERTRESFILITNQGHEETVTPTEAFETTQLSPRVGMSSEWDGTTQPKQLRVVCKTRSKSVRVKSSNQEPLTVVQPFTPPPVVAAEGGSVEQHDVNHRSSLIVERPENESDKSNDKAMSRTKSLKFKFRQKIKPTTAPPPPPTQHDATPQSCNTTFSVFKFGFGNRFRKPKGPRKYPETWI